MHQTKKESGFFPLGAIGVFGVLAAAFLWWSSPTPAEPPPLLPTPTETHANTEPEVAQGDPKEIQREQFIREVLPGATRATLIGLISAPRWVEFPSVLRLDLIPQAGNAAKAQKVFVRPGSRSFQFSHVPLGNWRLEMNPAGFERVGMALTISAKDLSPRVTLPLTPARYLRGTVTYADGSPAVEISVHADPLEKILGFSSRRSQTTTNANGEFFLKGLPPHAYRVQCGARDFPLGQAVEVQLLGKESWVELEVPWMGQLSLHLFEEETREPVSEGQVLVQRIGGKGTLGHAAREKIPEEGRVLFGHLPPGNYSISIFTRNWHRKVQRCTVVEQEEVTLSIPLKRKS